MSGSGCRILFLVGGMVVSESDTHIILVRLLKLLYNYIEVSEVYLFRDFVDKNIIEHKNGFKNIKYNMKKGMAIIKVFGDEFGGREVKILLSYIGYVMKKYGKMCRKLVIQFDILYPKDKLSYIILEHIIFELLELYKTVIVQARGFNSDISTEGLKDSPLVKYITKKISDEEFRKLYKKRIFHDHFRRIINQNDAYAVSNLMSDIKTFLKLFNISENEVSTISKITSELADNAGEHACSECLIDIDISSEYEKEGAPGEKYYSVNICALNFSNICLDDIVREKIVNSSFKDEERYIKVSHAYKKHKQFFDKNYTDDHFFMMAAFQNKISGRKKITESGWIGLYEMISAVEKRADKHNCYVLSKDKVIRFHPKLLVSNYDNWVGFNKEKDFLNSKPAPESIACSDTYLTGTGYNLTLIYRRCD